MLAALWASCPDVSQAGLSAAIVVAVAWVGGCAPADPNDEAWAQCEEPPLPLFFTAQCPLELSCEDPNRTFDEAVEATRDRFGGCYSVARCNSEGSFAIGAGYLFCGSVFEGFWFFDSDGALVGLFAGAPNGLSGYYAEAVPDPQECLQPSSAFRGNRQVLFGDDAGCLEDWASDDPGRYCITEMEYSGSAPWVNWCDGSGG